MIEFQTRSQSTVGKSRILSSILPPNNVQQSTATIDEVEKHIMSISKNAGGRSKGNTSVVAWETVRNANPKPIGLLNNGDLPDLDLPAELDEHKIGTFVEYVDNGDEDDEYKEWIPFSVREKSGKRKLLQKKDEGKPRKSSRKKAAEEDDNEEDEEYDAENDKAVQKAEKVLEEANNVNESDLFNYLSNI